MDTATREQHRNRLRLALNIALTDLASRGLAVEADVIRSASAEETQLPLAVVIGEIRSGRSSLVNALVRCPGLSPVGPTGAGALVSIRPCAPGEPARVVVGSGSDGVPLEQLPSLAAAAQSDGTPLRATVYLPDLPAPVVIVDTPGTGSPDDPQVELSLRWAARGGLVIVAVDAGSPMASTVLDLLRACALRVEHVVVALTMIDKYPSTWPAVAAGLRERLARDPALARIDVVPFSARIAESAGRLSADAADAALAASGVAELSTRLVALAEGARLVTVENGLRQARGLYTTRLRLAELATVEAALSDQQAADHIEDLRVQLQRLKDHEARWAIDFNKRVRDVERDLGRWLAERMATFESETRHQLAALPLLVNQELSARLLAALRARFELVEDDLREQLTHRLTVVVDELGLEADGLVRVEGGGTDSVDVDAFLKGSRSPGPVDLQLGMMAFTGFRIGQSFLRGADLAVPGSSWLAGGVGALAYSALHVLSRGQAGERAAIAAIMREATSHLRGALGQLTRDTVADVVGEVMFSYRRLLAEREAALVADHNRARAARAAGVTEVAQRKADATAALAPLAAAAAEIDAALAGDRGTTSVPRSSNSQPTDDKERHV